jgi:very-short-patch-repair endonuclease
LGSHTSRLSGIALRRSDVSAGETVTRRGHTTTSVVRTLADLGRRLPLVQAVAALDMALHNRVLKSDDLRAWVCAHPRYPGIARLRRSIELAEPATESVMETRLRLLLVMARLPRPQAQVPLHDRAGRFLGRPDFYYPFHRLALEYDGAGHRENLTGDNRRQNRLVDAGYRLLRFTAADVLSAPDSTVALVRRALSAK